jgi:hypothetical protein
MFRSRLCRTGSPNGKVMSPAVGRDLAIGPSGSGAFGTDNFWAQPRTSPSGFMFARTQYATVWLSIQMIGRFREKRSFCGGERRGCPGRKRTGASRLSELGGYRICRRRRALELQSGMQRPSAWAAVT